MKRHAMLDMESIGTKAGYAVLSIGAVIIYVDGVGNEIEFGDIASPIYIKFDINDQIKGGYLSDKSTRSWWAVHNYEARKVLLPATEDVPTHEGLVELYHYLTTQEIDFFWAKGGMDFEMLGCMYAQEEVQSPWNFWQERDLRGLLDLAPPDALPKRTGFIAHDAMQDAEFQMAQLRAALRHLHELEPALITKYTGEAA